MSRFDVDLFVIGGGSGGVRAARVAATHGARVAVAEESKWGGTCVVRGCVPKKLMVYASAVRWDLDDARGQGWMIPPGSFDWLTFITAKDKEIARLSAAYAGALTRAGARLYESRAVLLDPHTVEVGGTRVTAANILIATGGTPKKPATGEWITSDDAFHLPALPERIAILGAGYIAIEFAHIFAGFGSRVTLVHRSPQILRGFDPDIVSEVHKGLVAHGIETHHAPTVPPDSGLAMSAIGRAPNIDGLGLDAVGVTLAAHGGIAVDEWSRTSVPDIYAVGDVTARVALTPVAIREGHALADTLFGRRPTPMHYDKIPTAVFSQPPAAAVGLTQPAAEALGHELRIFKARFRPMKHALAGRDEHVMIKLVVDAKTDRVLGLHMVGLDAPEIVQAAAIAISMHATKADFDRTFALHPTIAEELVTLRG
ncbi:MAG: FAD-dependent oxidoreductase [Deltaproteobacteria bacterium]|nr:FAD-dependent oxidoreductase [Deltaproteobacteria bacterium]